MPARNSMMTIWTHYRQHWKQWFFPLMIQGACIFILLPSTHCLGNSSFSQLFMLIAVLISVYLMTLMLLAEPEHSFLENHQMAVAKLLPIALSTFLILVLALLLTLPWFLFLLSPSMDAIWQQWLTSLGISHAFLFSVVGLLLGLWMCFPLVLFGHAIPISVFQPVYGLRALMASAQLTWGHWWQNFSTIWVPVLLISLYEYFLCFALFDVMGLNHLQILLVWILLVQATAVPWLLSGLKVGYQELASQHIAS